MNPKPKILALSLLLGVLLVGVVAGAAADRVVTRRQACAVDEGRRESGRERRAQYLDWLTSELSLSPEQRAEVQLTVERHREAVSALWREMRPHFEARKTQLRDEIRQVLDEQQRAAYETLLEQESERRHHSRRGQR